MIPSNETCLHLNEASNKIDVIRSTLLMQLPSLPIDSNES